MTIGDIISAHYDELHSKCETDMVVSMSRTGEDILQDVCITAMRKYKDKDIEDSEGLTYLKKTLFTEQHFQKARLKGEIISYVDNIENMGI